MKLRPGLVPAILFAFANALGCQGESKNRERQISGVEVYRLGPETPRPLDSDEQARRDCERRLRDVLSTPGVSGLPVLEASRARFFTKVKAEPVLFVRAPQYTDEGASPTVKGYRRMLLSRKNPFGFIMKILAESEGFPKQARSTLLRDGYLYAEDAQTGEWLTNLVQPQDLFGQDRIWIQRGEQVLHAERRHGQFFYTDGILEGQRVRFILFDRAGASEGPGPPVHRDVRALRYRLHFDRMLVRHVTEDHIVANLHYGSWWVPTVLDTTGAHVDLSCEILAPLIRVEVERVRKEAARRELAVQALRRVMLAEVDEALPFDEPLHEYGFQLDGTLRGQWLRAYLGGQSKFDFKGDRYQVFDRKGRPLVPQVCVDFLTDTLERASGTWWEPRGETPGRTEGKLDFQSIEGVDATQFRRAPGFVSFAKGRPEAFEVFDDEKHIELGDEPAFFDYLEEHVSDFALGDAVLIKGKTPWDLRHVHFHSFFIYEKDPVTGMPIAILGNAGRPAIRIWETEVRRAPKRAIMHRIRFRTSWLESILRVKPLESPPPLAAGPD